MRFRSVHVSNHQTTQARIVNNHLHTYARRLKTANYLQSSAKTGTNSPDCSPLINPLVVTLFRPARGIVRQVKHRFMRTSTSAYRKRVESDRLKDNSTRRMQALLRASTQQERCIEPGTTGLLQSAFYRRARALLSPEYMADHYYVCANINSEV